MTLTRMALRNIGRNSKRSLLSIIATSIATFVIVFLFSFLSGLYKDMENTAVNYLTGEIEIRNRLFDDKSFSLDRAVDDYLSVLIILNKNLPGKAFSPRIKFPSTVIDKKEWDKSYSSFGIGVDFKMEEKYMALRESIINGVMPEDPRDVIMGIGLAEELNLSIGDKFTPITLTRLGASTGITFMVSALARFPDSSYTNKTFLVSLENLPEMLHMKGAVSSILIKGFGKRDLENVEGDINTLLQNSGFGELEAVSWKRSSSFQFIEMAKSIYSIMAFFFFVLASSVIANTMLMVVFERRKEIGTVTALGMTGKEVVRLFFIEALFLGLIGAACGVILGTIVVLPLSIVGLDLSAMTASVDFNASFYIFPQLGLSSTLVVFIYSVTVASVVSYFPSRGASKVDPVVALRSE